MAEYSFQEVMKQWRRLCDSNDDLCSKCPTFGECPACCKIKDININKFAEKVMQWAAEYPEPIYPTWFEWLNEIGVLQGCVADREVAAALLDNSIPRDIAEKLELKPKE